MPYTSGIFLNNDVGFKINSVDLSDHVTAFSLNRQADQLEVTSMGDQSHRFVTGLSADQITVTLLNDRGAGSVLATLQAAFGTTVSFAAIQSKTDPVATTNVMYSGTILVDNIPVISGTPMDEATIEITFTCNSKTAVATTGTF
jgi:hypothetical protein